MKRLLLMFLTMTVMACGNKKKEEKEMEEKEQPAHVTATSVQLTDAQMKNAEIATGKLELRNISSVLKVNGKVDVPPQNMVSISVPLGGYLKSTRLLPGTHVTKGQSIALMEDPQYIELQREYLTTKTKLIYAEQEFHRQKQLNESKASSDKVFQQAQAEYNSQMILLRSLSEKLRLININPDRLNAGNISRTVSVASPITGFVSKVNVNIGKYVNPSDALFEIVNPNDIHLSLDVFEKDVNKLFIGQKVFAYTNNNPVKKYRCKIILISKDISEDKSFEVHCHFDNYDKDLLPGMFMNAEIEVQNKDAWVIVSDAIVNYENKKYLFVQKKANSFEMIEVVPGDTENGYTAIDNRSLDSLRGQSIVVKGAYSLLMKMKNTTEEE